ncbi:hypothetical protein FBUS_05902 [Fasciolopsis buskii]|uniref:Intraflagellar transport protein 25 homolog n=1 Tax=Fasciolopsis buskii TaxID=27845 RepID=A0A8E0VKA0_9TREM|nr:hypothetical protein FBUS_05902 [Fasciolopsis buski]
MLNIVERGSEKYILLSTSFDEVHPPENVLNNDETSFWATTGIFPQMLVVSLSELTKIGRVRIISSCIRDLWIEVSAQNDPENFEVKSELSLSYADGHQQVTEIPTHDSPLRHLRLNIRSGYDHFVAVYKVTFERK